MQTDIALIVPILRSKKTFVLTTHVNPDGDGIGSEVALAGALRGMGKEVRIINHSPTPAVYRFLDSPPTIELFRQEIHAQVIADAEVIIVLDSNHTDRLRSMEESVLSSRAVKICIDHHLDTAPFADHYLIDEDATSTGEIVYRLLLTLTGPMLSSAVAGALYCAIMTDTGSFRYPRVDAETHRIVAHLIECGADPVGTYADVYESWSAGRIRLLGEMLTNLSTSADGKIAHVTVTQQMLKRTGTSEEDTDNFTTFPMSVDGVVAGILFLELQKGFKISFRSRGDIPINELAKEFGGNGHKNAAGARIYDRSLEEVRDKVITAAERYVRPEGPTHP